MPTLEAFSRYTAVSIICAILHLLILNVGAIAGVHYIESVLASFVVCVVAGFYLHACWTFRQGCDVRSFVSYSAAMALNVPGTIVLLWLLVDLAHLPMVLAAPLSTVLLAAMNFLISSRIFGPRPRLWHSRKTNTA